MRIQFNEDHGIEYKNSILWLFSYYVSLLVSFSVTKHTYGYSRHTSQQFNCYSKSFFNIFFFKHIPMWITESISKVFKGLVLMA